MDKAELAQRFQENLDRVRNLVGIYDNKITTTRQGRNPIGSTDVLRSAVVLLHATLEDFVREVSRHYLPQQGENVLKDIPLAKVNDHGRTVKFHLGHLAGFRGKTVDELLSESVADYLERSNYNRTDELTRAIIDCGLDKTAVESLYPTLTEMMERRHWIVHRADRNLSIGRGQHKAKSIGTHHVNVWIEAVEKFTEKILAQIP